MSNSLIMMALGTFRFGISTAAFQDLDRSNSYRWAAQERVGAKPTRQWMGEGDDTVNLAGIIYPHFAGQSAGLEQVALMRAQAAQGIPLLMVDGSGRVWGFYCITDVRERQKTFFSDGRPRAIEFDLSLAAYGDDVAAIATGSTEEVSSDTLT